MQDEMQNALLKQNQLLKHNLTQEEEKLAQKDVTIKELNEHISKLEKINE